MKIHHIALYCKDLESMRDFFMKYFDASSNEGYHNPRTGLRTYFLTFPQGDCSLEIMTRPGVAPGAQEDYPQGFVHMSFSVGSRENVDRFAERFSDDGFAVVDGPRLTGDGFYECAVRGPEGILIEITV